MHVISFKFLNYSQIFIGKNLLKNPLLADICQKLQRRWIIITDSHLAQTLAQELQNFLSHYQISAKILSFPAGESSKTRQTKEKLEDELCALGYGRDTAIIALGGGVVTDLVGFLAATYCRGIPVIYIPTTLLAMVDASIGGKTGVNTTYGKNLIGTFTQPYAVWMDIKTLETLPEAEWRNGITEMIKHSVIADAAIFAQLLAKPLTSKDSPEFLIEMIHRSVAIKKQIVEQDEKDEGIRQWLNFGHTIGHAIEKIENYQISHGEAVAIGMIVEAYLSYKSGFLPENMVFEIEKILQLYGLTLHTTAFNNLEVFKKALKLDKKATNNKIFFVLLDSIGKPHINAPLNAPPSYTSEISLELLDLALEWARIKFSHRFQDDTPR